MNWISLIDDNQLQEIIAQSNTTPQVIFKHSTRCNISSVVLNRLKESNKTAPVTIYYLDLLKYRPISDKVADVFNEHHESPQILVIKNGVCTYTESHLGITMNELLEQTMAD